MIEVDPQDRLIHEIEAEFQETASYTGRSRPSEPVIGALRRVRRDRFVPEAGRPRAWANVPLPIGNGQTISQPFIVAIMTELLDLSPSSKVLEIGTGSGYQTAILAELAGHVYTVEVIGALAERAQSVLAAMGYTQYRLPGRERRRGVGDESAVRRGDRDRRRHRDPAGAHRPDGRARAHGDPGRRPGIGADAHADRKGRERRDVPARRVAGGLRAPGSARSSMLKVGR